MQQATSFPALWNLFGGSIFRDEYRGNFKEANERIEAQLRSATDNLAGILQAKAVHRLISGNIHEAEQILDNMRARDSMFGLSWQLRAELYRRIILDNGTLLHPFDSCLDLPEFQMNLTTWLQRRTPSRINELDTAWTPEHKIENTWIDQDIWAVRLRTLATQIPSTSPVHPKSGDTDQQKNIIGAVGQPLAGLRQSGCPAGYGLRLQADIFHILESPDSLPKLRESAQAYKSNGDLVGEATCIMKEGDWLCSQRYSNITALNMVICESTSYIGSSRWDAVEDDLALGQINEARSLYTKVQELFHIASAPRGVAAIYLRKACLTLFERLLNDNGDPPRDNDQYSEARANLQTAYSAFLFAGDWLSAKLAETHMIILDIYSSRSDNATAANEIGSWGKQTKNIQYVHGLGLLFLRLGNYTWRKSRTFDTSRLLLQAAKTLFAGLDTRISEIQAEASGAQILCEVLDLGSARIAFLSAEHKLNDMLSYLAEEQVPFSLWKKQLEIVKSTLAVAMEPLFFYLGETTTLRRLLETVQGIRDNTEVVQERRSREPRLIVHLSKLEYKDRIKEDDMSGGIQCLDQGLNALSALDAKVYGEGRQIARINILGEMMRYDEAREILREMHRSQDMDEDFKTYIETTNSRNMEYFMTQRYETFLHLAINVLDFELARHYKDKLETLGNDQYSKKNPHDFPNSALVLLSLSSLHEGFGEFEEAIIHINACLIAIEADRSNISESSARMTSFGHNEVFEAFDTAMRICFKLHKNGHPTLPSGVECTPRLTCHSWIEQALVFAERGKARTMLDSIQDNLDQLSKDEEYDVNKQVVGHGKRKIIEQITKSAKVVSRLEALIEFPGQGPTEPQEYLRGQLSAENSRLAMLEEKFAQAAPEALVAENRRSFGGIRTYSKSLSIRETAKALPSDTVVLEFATTYNGVGIFAIGTRGILASHWAEISKIDLQQLILDFLLLMKEKNPKMAQRGERINKIVQMLSETLLKPVSDALEGAENIVFVPSGILFNFPLGMLEISSEPLILNYTTAQVPSLTVWQELNRIGQIADKKPKSKVTAAVLCNSKEVVESQLPYVRAEALAISQIFSIKPIVANKVSTSQLIDMGRNCDVFHCCCHGSFDHDAPLLSNIQLHSKAGPGDLSIIDMVTMVGPAKLVVLSACFSGFGKILGSNDGYSFPHALLSIGVRAFVGSLWSSDDGAALIFMYMFYRQLLHGRELKEDSSGDDVSIAQAFTSAQRQLRTMSRTAYNECIDSIISELKAIDSKTSRRVVGMSQQLFRLKVLKEDRDPARFADCFYWAAFVLTGNGLQTLRG